MDSQPLFIEDINDALKEAIRACGGFKAVATVLWREKSPEAAVRMLHDCLNPHRAERLNPEQFVLILQMAGAKGYHRSMEYIAERAGYRAEPVVVEDMVVEAQRELADTMRHLDEQVQRVERLLKTAGRLRAVGQ